MLHKKDLLLNFYEPKGAQRNGLNFDCTITRYPAGTANRKTAYRLDFFSQFIDKFGEKERLSVKFDGGRVFFVFDVPVDAGAPFYKIVDRNRTQPDKIKKGLTVNNKDLIDRIMDEMDIKKKSKLYCNLEKKGDIGSLTFYELVVKETRI